jgi:hypothetical protein
MLRKLNFTERTKIPRTAVEITLRRDEDGVLVFDPHLDLTSVRASAEARVYLEAYYRTSYMRFDCGTLGALSYPKSRRLDEIDSDRVVRFRVKVIDHTIEPHRIVAVADDITVAAAGDDGGARISLLPVTFTDLGDLPWRVHVESAGPTLELNNRIDGIERLATSDASFFALVYPAAVREILTHVLVVERYELEDEEEWWALWMRWARELHGEEVPDEIDDRAQWIDDAVQSFCARHRAVERMQILEVEDES